jgi:protein tyrosine phosphatase (PTP) superfamily phosphohydrolase (DUF442 family)
MTPATSPATATLAAPSLATTKPVDAPGLHQLVAYGPALYSGAVPEGDEGFESLRAMGIRTIISVDGAQPDVDRAKKFGLRYVHLPIGYDGMSEDRAKEIARAARDLPGPIYIHCHHGKHRSAGAAASTAVMLGYLDNDAALARMKVSGTAPAYPGLFKCAADARPASKADLDSADASFPEHWKTSSFVQTMVEIDDVHDRLKLIDKAGWTVPTDHPDLVPAAEAGKLADLYRHAIESEDTRQLAPEMVEWLRTAQRNASKLEESIVAGTSREQVAAQMKLVSQSCNDCHVKYRN